VAVVAPETVAAEDMETVQGKDRYLVVAEASGYLETGVLEGVVPGNAGLMAKTVEAGQGQGHIVPRRFLQKAGLNEVDTVVQKAGLRRGCAEEGLDLTHVRLQEEHVEEPVPAALAVDTATGEVEGCCTQYLEAAVV
jgi:hypothetical protein